MTNNISGYPQNNSVYASYNQQQKTGVNEPNTSAKSLGEDKTIAAQQNTSDAIEISLEAQKAARNATLSGTTMQDVTPSSITDKMTDINSGVILSREQFLEFRAEQRAKNDPFNNEEFITNGKWIPTPVHSYANFVSYTRADSYKIELTEMLEGKARNASMVANELVNSLQGSIINNGATLAQRAETREAAFRSALYIADNYFPNPNEAKAFMDLITKIRDEDIMREKGYVFPTHTIYVDGVIEVNTMEPFRNYSAPGMGNDYISPVGTARFLGAPESMLQRGQFFANGTSDIINFITGAVAGQSFSSESSAVSWDARLRQGILDGWHSNEREVSAIINQTAANFDPEFGERFLQRILKAF